MAADRRTLPARAFTDRPAPSDLPALSSRLRIALAGVLVLAVLVLLGFTYLPYVLRGGATRYAPDYSALAFQSLHKNQAMGEVIRRIGRPLTERRVAAVDGWIYQEPDWIGAPKRIGIPAPATRRWHTDYADVHFDAEGRVVAMLGGMFEPSIVGWDRARLRERFGPPVYTLTRPALIVHDYSAPAATDVGAARAVWKVRRVIYGADARVLAAQGFTHFREMRDIPSINPFQPER
jgi:hypothetical protein